MNRYLVTRSGRFVGTRVPATLLFFAPVGLSFLVLVVGLAVSLGVDSGAVAALSVFVAVALFIAAVVSQWLFLWRGLKSVETATHAWLAGDFVSPIDLCHVPLGRVFRADVRTRALHVLGLVAEANGDFVEAADLFERASLMVPSFAQDKWQRHARVLMFSHRAIALVATSRLDEADACVRAASALFPPRAPGALDFLTNDEMFGAVGVSAAMRDLEPGRNARALLTFACVVTLSARGMVREAIDLVERERPILHAGLLPREQALVTRAEMHARGLLAGGPMRMPGVAPVLVHPDAEAWADRVLGSRL